MRLSVRGEYALRALLVLGLNYDLPVVRIQTIAAQQRIPKRFLEQILNDLKAAGIVESRRGSDGGYRLRMPPEQISLARVVRHLEGPLAPVSCVSERFYEPCSCPDESRCGVRSVMKEIRDAIVALLEGYTLATFCERARHLAPGGIASVDYAI